MNHSLDEVTYERLTAAVRRIEEASRGRPRTGTVHDDADGEIGTFATDDALGFDPRPVLQALSDHGADVVVMGQVAGILHGSSEPTGDLDLLWDGDARQAQHLADAFASLRAEITDPDGQPLAGGRDAFLGSKVYFRTPTASGDCCTPTLPWGSLDIAGIIARAERVVWPTGPVRFVSRDDLLVMRRAVARPKDVRRVAELERLQATSG